MAEREGTDERGRRLIAGLLRVGLGAASALLVAGIALKLVAGDLATAAVRPHDLVTSRSLGDALLAWGVVVLAVTPFVRVIALGAVWARVRDWRFVAVAVAVIALLAAAATLGGG